MGLFDGIKKSIDLKSLEKRKNQLIEEIKNNKHVLDNEISYKINDELVEIEEKIQKLKNES